MNELDKGVREYRSKKKFMARTVWNVVHVFKTGFWLTFVIHGLACFWLGLGLQQTQVNEDGWIDVFDLRGLENEQLYVWSVEFITATFTTIGYGSLFAVSETEKSIMPLLMVLSLILFSLIM